VQSICSTGLGRDGVAYAGRRKLRTPDAAAYVGLAASTLNKMRVRGDGPVYSKLGRIVVYDVADLERVCCSSGTNWRDGLAASAAIPVAARIERSGLRPTAVGNSQSTA
jgi:hypothetical protein